MQEEGGVPAISLSASILVAYRDDIFAKSLVALGKSMDETARAYLLVHEAMFATRYNEIMETFGRETGNPRLFPGDGEKDVSEFRFKVITRNFSYAKLAEKVFNSDVTLAPSVKKNKTHVLEFDLEDPRIRSTFNDLERLPQECPSREQIKEYFPDSNQRHRLIERLVSELKRTQRKLANATEARASSAKFCVEQRLLRSSHLEVCRSDSVPELEREIEELKSKVAKYKRKRATRNHPYVIPE
jgi:hypothetical protein